MAVWLPGARFAERVLRLAAERNIRGARIFDLQIALTGYDCGATEIWSHDRGFLAVKGMRVIDPI